MKLEKELGNILLVISAIIAIAILIYFIGAEYTGFAIYNYNYTGNETSYEIITPENYDKILTSDKDVINYDIINKGNGNSRWNWKESNGFIVICNSEIEDCLNLNETTTSYWYITQNYSNINQNSGEESVISWINKDNKTKREFWVGFEDLPLSSSDKDYNDVLFRIQKKKDLILINLAKQASGYTNPSNILFHFDSPNWFVTYKISKHIYLGDNKWNNSNEEIFEYTGDLEYNIIYDDSIEGQWIRFEFANITDTGNNDNDSVINEYDNCINISNSDQKNSDGDSFGNVCDNCPFIDNENQLDSDNNGIGDACEPICNENWNCSDFGECVNNTKTRICEDLNNCGTEEERPVEIEECNTSESQENSTNETQIPAPSSGGSSGGGGGTYIPSETRTLEQPVQKEITIPEETRILEKKVDLCNNGIKDQDEKEIDCGGSCPECMSVKTILPYTNYMLFVLMVMVILTLLDKGRAGIINN